MKVLKKIIRRQQDIYNTQIPVIAFIGDSVTQGCFECETVGENSLTTVFDSKSGYVKRFEEIMSLLYPCVQIDYVNAGMNGADTSTGLNNLEQNVLSHRPDLVVVSFGLNDSVKGEEGIEQYKKNLGEMFDKILSIGSEAIFLTQNYMCDHTSHTLKDKLFIDLSKDFAKIQNDGLLDKYFEEAIKECDERNIKVCDVRKTWKLMKDNHVDTTELLANKLNHPVRELHYYMAIKLLEKMFED